MDLGSIVFFKLRQQTSQILILILSLECDCSCTAPSLSSKVRRRKKQFPDISRPDVSLNSVNCDWHFKLSRKVLCIDETFDTRGLKPPDVSRHFSDPSPGSLFSLHLSISCYSDLRLHKVWPGWKFVEYLRFVTSPGQVRDNTVSDYPKSDSDHVWTPAYIFRVIKS